MDNVSNEPRPIRSFKTNSISSYRFELKHDEIITLNKIEEVFKHKSEESEDLHLSLPFTPELVYIWDVIHVPEKSAEQNKEIVEQDKIARENEPSIGYTPVKEADPAMLQRTATLMGCQYMFGDFDLSEAIVDHVNQLAKENETKNFDWRFHPYNELWVNWKTTAGECWHYNSKKIFSLEDYRVVSGIIKELMGEIDMRRIACEIISANFKKVTEVTPIK